MKDMARTAIVAAALVAPPGADAWVTDRNVHPPVNYYVLVPPPAGQSYLDPAFGTTIRRISDARSQPNAADGGELALIGNEYSTMSPFNQDNTRLLLAHQGYFGLYDGNGTYQGHLPFDMSASSEPRWSRRDPNLLYYVWGNVLKSYDVATGVRTVLHSFAGYSRIQGRGESDICLDGDHLVLVGDDRDIFVYELSTDTVGPALDATGHPFDNVYIAPGDQVIVTWLQPGTGPRSGIELYDRDMRFLRQLAPAGGHMDVGRDTSGEPVLLWINAGDPRARPDCPNGVVKVRLADAEQTCVLALGWGGVAAHVSAPDGGEWFVVSTYAPGDPRPIAGEWPRYAGEIMQVRLDGSEVRRLAHHRSRPFNTYGYTPRAAVSRDGSRIVYTSNHGLPSILGYGSYYTDAYLLDLTTAAPAYAGSSLPLVARYEQDDASVSYTGSWYNNGLFFHSGGSAVLSADPGARATFRFAGTSVRCIGYRDEWSGTARAYVDGQLRAEVDTFLSPGQAQGTLFTATGLAPGQHTLEVEVSGARGPLSGGPWVWLDAFEVAARVEQDDAAVSSAAGWEESALDTHSGGRALRAVEPGAQATFRFRGRGVTWIGRRDESSGIARVSLDGALRAEVDTYAAAPEHQVVVYTLSGLPPGEHTLTIEVSGRRHPLSTGVGVWVDAFETLPE